MKMDVDQLARFLDSFHQGIALVDADMKVIAGNVQFHQLLPDCPPGGSLTVTYPYLAPQIADYVSAALDGTPSRIERFPWANNGSTSHWLIYFNPVSLDLEAGRLAMLIIEDISEQVRMVSQFESNYNELQHQLLSARRYQDALFTDHYSGEDVSCRAYAKPCFELSGDFFHASRYGESSLFIIGDVQSHGIDVALRSITLQHLARMWFSEQTSPAKVMSDLNDFIIGDQDEGLWLCCLLVVYYNRQFGTVTYCRAGIPDPVLMRRDGEVVPMLEGSTPLGAFPGEDYVEASMTVYPHDRMLLFSDGITETRQRGNISEMYGHENLVTDYRRLAVGNPDHQLLHLLECLHSYKGSQDFDDDVTLAEIIFR